MLQAYLAHRRDGETFHAFANRYSEAELAAMFAQIAEAA